jgi:hypothetical protein
MRRYAGQNEVRFKVADKQKAIYDETAWYLYENNLMEKSNIQSFGRWCMDYVCKFYRQGVIESRIMKQQQQRPNPIQKPHPFSYPPYFTRDPTQPL